MRTLAVAALLASALTGCALTMPPPVADPAPPQANLLAEKRAAAKNITTGATQPRPASGQAALDVDRINKKLAGEAATSQPTDCGAREGPAYVDAHATWGDTAQDLQRRKTCASQRATPR
jgi:hypothetical protein